ncbi:MAG TPA: NAD-dependent epimerase/dehydratase family protein [Candidatus Limnocylindria bacterium]|nr:NAD-dependent epimerase/dehydratase family protein [Candidatus Limnocylindria bacterium]
MFFLTGAAGFLGGAVVRFLAGNGARVRALVLPGDPLAARLPAGVEVCFGDLTDEASLDRFFALPQGEAAVVIHCASVITMSLKPVAQVYEVNVRGLSRVLRRCASPGIRGLVYVSSVHAIPEKPRGETMAEPDMADPALVTGYYAKTKAEAAALVMKARRKTGLAASIVYPAGLCGPGDHGAGNLTQLILDYAAGRIPMCVSGGYNFADVRDVAQAVCRLALSGAFGEDYVLAGDYITVADMFAAIANRLCGKAPPSCPLFLARLGLPLFTLGYRLRGVRPVFSSYALMTVRTNSLFDSGKARRDLGFDPRPAAESIRDSVDWLVAQGRLARLRGANVPREGGGKADK